MAFKGMRIERSVNGDVSMVMSGVGIGMGSIDRRHFTYEIAPIEDSPNNEEWDKWFLDFERIKPEDFRVQSVESITLNIPYETDNPPVLDKLYEEKLAKTLDDVNTRI